MARLSQIAKVLIALNTASIKKASFGIPLIVAPTTAFDNRVKIYSNVDAARDDGMEAAGLSALSAAFSQTPRPSVVYVGRRHVETVTLNALVTAVAQGDIFTIKSGASTFSYTALSGDDLSDVYTGLADQLKANSVVSAAYDVTSSADSLVLKTKSTDTNLKVEAGHYMAAVAAGDSTNIAADLVAINKANKDWYGFSLVELSDQLALQTAIWAETQTKIFFSRSASPENWQENSTTDLASQLQAGSYLRTALVVHKAAAVEYPDAAWMGRCFTMQPGSETWALKDLVGVTASDFDEDEQQIIWKKNANTYEDYGDGVFVVNPGKVSGDEWIDVIRGRDFAEDYIQKNVASAKIRSKKIPYTNPGIQTLVNVTRGSLVDLQTMGIIAPDEVNGRGETVPGFVLTYPNAADVSADIKAKRTLYLGFNSLLAGAIQVTEIEGTMSYSYEGV